MCLCVFAGLLKVIGPKVGILDNFSASEIGSFPRGVGNSPFQKRIHGGFPGGWSGLEFTEHKFACGMLKNNSYL